VPLTRAGQKHTDTNLKSLKAGFMSGFFAFFYTFRRCLPKTRKEELLIKA
jgi:hypothetical protein